MTTTADPAAFMLAIAADLGNDVPRRVCADLLEEQGEQDRANFIRVQCDIAKYEADLTKPYEDQDLCESVCARWCPVCGDCCCREPEGGMNDSDCPLHAPTSRHHSDDSLKSVVASLHAREVELFAEHGRDWFREVFELLPDAFGLGWVRRGWPAAITLSVGTLCGERCRRCGGNGMAPPFVGLVSPTACPGCHGRGTTPGIAAELGRACPTLEAVTVTGREAFGSVAGPDGLVWWYVGPDLERPASHHLPPKLGKLLDGWLPITRRNVGGEDLHLEHCRGYTSPAAARDALNAAALRLIRLG